MIRRLIQYNAMQQRYDAKANSTRVECGFKRLFADIYPNIRLIKPVLVGSVPVSQSKVCNVSQMERLPTGFRAGLTSNSENWCPRGFAPLSRLLLKQGSEGGGATP